MSEPTWTSGDVTLYLGDCLEVLPTLVAGSVDAVVTDPPYGVGFEYTSHEDSKAAFPGWLNQWFPELRRVAAVIVLTPGITNLFCYPAPDWTCAYFKPGSTRHNGFGSFNEWEPILVYGKVKTMTDAKRFPDCVNHIKGPIAHPCPKPVNAFRWMVEMVGGAVLDPFMGSGTTGVACVQTGRRFIGIEIDAGYFEIAKKRIEQAQQQMRLPL